MSVTYGLKVMSKDDPYIITATRGIQPLIQAVVPGAFLVDFIPALKYVPEWFPYAGFQRKAKEWRSYAMEMLAVPFEATKRSMVCSISCRSIAFSLVVSCRKTATILPRL